MAPTRRALKQIEGVLSLLPPDFLGNLRNDFVRSSIDRAVAHRDAAALFDWLLGIIEMQGISDYSAAVYSRRNGRTSWRELEERFAEMPACPQLSSYWQFNGCGYQKTRMQCSDPAHQPGCFLPRLPLRNGRLSQGAVSLFLFIRDVCGGDLVGWLDDRFENIDLSLGSAVEHSRRLREAVLGPLRNIYGVGDKVLSMALADLLLGGDPSRERWVTAGAGMIAVDSLVHAFLSRTGTLRAFDAEHAYGPACTRPSGCTEVIELLAEQIDARAYDPSYPRYFPRWVQSAIWEFCAADRWNICNGNKIDDKMPCVSAVCPLGDECGRVVLYPPKKEHK